jgi:hypothetical protein
MPWAARAWAPTTRKSAPASDNAANISTKSRFMAEVFLECPGLEGKLPHHHHTLARGACASAAVPFGLAQTELADWIIAPIHVAR